MSKASKLFDVMGTVTPVTIRARICMQKIWQLGIAWDEKITDEKLFKEFDSIIEDFNNGKNIKINRRA